VVCCMKFRDLERKDKNLKIKPSSASDMQQLSVLCAVLEVLGLNSSSTTLARQVLHQLSQPASLFCDEFFRGRVFWN
jgi:hypothetical protein